MQPSPLPPTPAPTYHRPPIPTSLGMGPDQGRGSASIPHQHPPQESSLTSMTHAGSPELPFLGCGSRSPTNTSDLLKNVPRLFSVQTPCLVVASPFSEGSSHILASVHICMHAHTRTQAHTHNQHLSTKWLTHPAPRAAALINEHLFHHQLLGFRLLPPLPYFTLLRN